MNQEIQEWQPNVVYPHGSVVKYKTASKLNEFETTYAKKVWGYFNFISVWFGWTKEEPQFSYYMARGKFSNVCAPDDEWADTLRYFFA